MLSLHNTSQQHSEFQLHASFTTDRKVRSRRRRRERRKEGRERERRERRATGVREIGDGEKRWREIHLRVTRHVQQPHCWSKMYSVPSPNSLLAPLGPLERSMEGEERSTFWL